MKNPPNFRLKAPPGPTEKQVTAGCKAVMERRGYKPLRLHAGTFKSADNLRWIKGVAKGTPDYLGVHELYPGFLLELKRPGNVPSPLQEAKIWELRIGFRLAVVVIDDAQLLEPWIDAHEAGARKKWGAIRGDRAPVEQES